MYDKNGVPDEMTTFEKYFFFKKMPLLQHFLKVRRLRVALCVAMWHFMGKLVTRRVKNRYIPSKGCLHGE